MYEHHLCIQFMDRIFQLVFNEMSVGVYLNYEHCYGESLTNKIEAEKLYHKINQ